MEQETSRLAIALESPPPPTVERYRKYEARFALSRSFANPFDSREIALTGIFLDPSGQAFRVPGFLFRDTAGPHDPTLIGAPCWMVRFAPRSTGRWTVRVEAVAGNETAVLSLPPFDVTPSDSKGFIRCTVEKPGRFRFDSGDVFFPLGEVLWKGGPRHTADPVGYFEKNMDEAAPFGLNSFRFFIGHTSGLPIRNARCGPDRMDLAASRNLDHLLEAAESRGFHLNLGVEIWNEVRSTPPYAAWSSHPYNRANGGPCDRPRDTFSDPEARRLYREFLRYLLARWGHSTSLFLVQFQGEAEYTEDYDFAVGRDWHDEMARWFHQVDVYGHLVSSSLAIWRRDPSFFALESLDVSLPEIYDARDMGEGTYTEQSRMLSQFNKPCLECECGLNFVYGITDPEGIHVHNALWGSLLAGAGGTPEIWMYEYLHQNGLLRHHRALDRFIRGQDLLGLRPMAVGPIRYRNRPGTAPHANVMLPSIMNFMPLNGQTADIRGPRTLSVPTDALHPDLPDMPRIYHPLHGPDGVNHNPLTLDVDFAADGELLFYTYWLPDEGEAAIVSVRLDGEEKGPVRIPTAKGWEDRTAVYSQHCIPHAFPVTQGAHRIEVSNIGDAWAELRFDLFNYLQPDIPNLDVYALGNGDRACLWIHNRDSTWYWDWHPIHREPRTVPETLVALPGFAPGVYTVEWWDPYEGTRIGETTVEASRDGAPLMLALPAVVRDAACWIRKARP